MAVEMYGYGGKVRFSPRHPCPVCAGHADLPSGRSIRCYGFLSGDSLYAHCTRGERAGPLPVEANGTYAHRLVGGCRCGFTHGEQWQVAESAAGQSGGRSRHYDELPVWRDAAWRNAATYYYHSAEGAALYRIQRWERLDGSAKKFLQERADASSPRGWRAGLGSMERVPYHLPAIMRADPGRPILIAEGEKAADALVSLGWLATTNPEGARVGSWRPELSKWFAGRHVVILPDNDEVGLAHAREVATALRGTAASIRGLELPGLPPKGDVCDWLAAGGTREELRRLVEAAPHWHDAPRASVAQAALARMKHEALWWRT